MASGEVFLVLLLALFYVSQGYLFETNPKDVQTMYVSDNDFRVTCSFNYDISDKVRGQVLENIRAVVEVSPEYIKSSNSSWTLYSWCPNLSSASFKLPHITRVKQNGNTTEYYLDFSLQDGRVLECVKKGAWNLTVSLFDENIKLKTVNRKDPFSFQKLEANFKAVDCDFNTSSCLSWTTNGSMVHSDSCRLPWCKYIPKPKNTLSYVAATEEERTHWRSRDIYGSGTNCSLNILMTAYSATYVTVSLNSSRGSTPLMRKKFDSEKMNWTVVRIPIGRVDELFQLTVCIHAIYIAAVQRMWLGNCMEITEVAQCSDKEFQCSTGKCIPKDRVCDLNPDCPLQDDEERDFCDKNSYRAFCDVDSDRCNWTQSPQCPFQRKTTNEYNIVKYHKYCHYGQTDFVIFADKCKNKESSKLISPVMQPFNASKDCRVRFWYIADNFDKISVSTCFNESSCELVKTFVRITAELEWQRASVSIPHRYQPFQVVLHGSLASIGGIVALDQISFTPDCFTKSDEWMEPHMEEVSTQVELDDGSSYILTILGIGAGIVVAMVTAVVIFSVFKKRQNLKDESLRNILPVSTSTTSSGIDGKCSIPVDISDASSADSERQSLVPSNLAVSNISPYYEWTEDKIRDIPRKKIKLVRLLGKGAFGEVYYGLLADVSRLRTDLPIAVKKLPTLCAEQTKAELFFEAVTLSKFNHPNIVRFLGISTDDQDRSMYLLLELMEGGELRTFIRESRPKQPHEPSYLTLHDLLKLGIDVARGCHYLEQNKFIHRDIAARNCLLTEKGPNRVAKIGDFGMARDVLRTNYYRKNGRAMVPVKWMPPESFLDGIFTSKTDVWAFGVVLWELFSMGHVPYPGKSNGEVMKYVKGGGRLEKPPLCPYQIYGLMLRCWQVDADVRPNFTGVVEELNRINNEEEISSLITYEDVMGIQSSTCDQDHVTSGSVTYAEDIKHSMAETKLFSENDSH
ncbi:uncharacterized protein LOC133185319 [Saccostrea echinata]|uniref:uncharacterized protein LOC133185319 n=1 Tax=Saccostrea echinata TaxID=191078 RepID=UPI002A83D36C|nr:uncharacterized protein LOC133185319 [Saccostrea echinata]